MRSRDQMGAGARAEGEVSRLQIPPPARLGCLRSGSYNRVIGAALLLGSALLFVRGEDGLRGRCSSQVNGVKEIVHRAAVQVALLRGQFSVSGAFASSLLQRSHSVDERFAHQRSESRLQPVNVRRRLDQRDALLQEIADDVNATVQQLSSVGGALPVVTHVSQLAKQSTRDIPEFHRDLARLIRTLRGGYR